MQKISLCLWFDHQAEEAANFYISVFENSKILSVVRYGEAGPGPVGSVMTVNFVLDGMEITALNGGPVFNFNEAISLVVDCKSQEEVDRLWTRLTEGGEESMCGWLKDKYGVSWQIVPTVLIEMLQDKDPEKALRVSKALFQMKKIDIKTIQAAYNQS